MVPEPQSRPHGDRGHIRWPHSRETRYNMAHEATPLPKGGPGCSRRTSYASSLRNADYFVVRNLRDFLLAQTVERVGAGNRVGDVGCGEQPLRRAVEQVGARYLGIDITQNATRTVGVIAGGLDMPFCSDVFDVIFCTEVLEHIPDPATALRELARVLKPTGVLVCTSPFMYPLHEEPRDFHRLTPHFVRLMAEGAGLEIVQLVKLGSEAEVVATMAAHALARPSQYASPPLRYLDSGGRALLRLIVNLLTITWLRFPGHRLPTKIYLSTAYVLRKP